MVYNLSQWLLLVVLANVGGSSLLVGQFTLLLAITAPVFLTVGLNLRTLQVTDAGRRYELREFFVVRHATNVVAGSLSLAIGYLAGVRSEVFLALIVVCLAKSIEGFSTVSYGYLALRERFDLSSQSSLLRGVFGPVLFFAGWAQTHALWGAALGLTVAWGVVHVLFDRRLVMQLASEEGRPLGPWSSARPGALIEIVRRASPLGLDQGISSLAVNVPRYALEALVGTAKLGVFAGQAYLAQVVTMITMAMAGVLVPRLSRSYAQGRRRAFVRDLTRVCAVGAGLSVAAVVVGAALGPALLRMTLGPEYEDRGLLVALLVAAGFITMQRVLSKGLEASHHFTRYLAIDVLTLVAIAVPVLPLVRRFGLVGAAYASAFGNAVGTVAMLMLLVRIVRGMPSSPLVERGLAK